ncbi:hypothetical protein EG328_009219 [Venturia inaequalis]|uniref:Uncharacterized protein n=1 Tax=Venturia inaequalis TaxID=5025 RepID=A0A8H3YXS9_VENIN|nr:hypothetical protein EG328_009219 [Venturia inaequalis]KAE9975833.1 hypothetical protein EG327_008323 [Venturia inaequalis]RDI79634.1 Transcriptional regulatory protein [Venturia inaequalis]
MRMHFSLLTLTLTTLTSLAIATPHHGQYDYPQNTTFPETYVSPPTKSSAPSTDMGHGYNDPLTNSTSTSSTTAAHTTHPTSTGAMTPASSIIPFTGTSAPIKGASLALVIVAGVLVGWF